MERFAHNGVVRGSNPRGPTIKTIFYQVCLVNYHCTFLLTLQIYLIIHETVTVVWQNNNLISKGDVRAIGGVSSIYTCAPHRFTLFKCKPLCSVYLVTLLVTTKRGLNDSNTDKIIVLIESVNLSLIRANVNHLHHDSCLTCRNQNADLGQWLNHLDS